MNTTQKTTKILIILIWIAQIILSITLFWASYMKLFLPEEQLAEMWPWTAENRELVIITGVIDVSAAIGLIFPDIFKLKSKMPVYTAFGLIVLMISAIVLHICRGEASQIGINIFFLIVAVFIIWAKKYSSTKTIKDI